MTAWINVFLLSVVMIKCTDVPSQKAWLIAIHRNKTHLLNMSCCHSQKHQQQRYNNGNTEINMRADTLYVH